ncbi:MAG: hypothetical protein ABF453_02835 [Bifidobacterium psychraerophilum]|uniref:hypothetical protein n=1 Tax=Bifidobacterium psychraerophilum TaxID=218140 RepID=UPI0039E89FA0
MSIIAHPLTQLDGSPQYAASDYRKAVNALILPSDGTTFGTVQGIRAGSPSPLMSVNSTTVTVRAHAGILCPWTGVGAYTYQMDTDTSVSIADTTGTYKIALVLSDPSQSHGTTPELALQSFPGTTPNTAIAGLVLGQIVAGVGSDIAPRILQQTLISVSTLSILQSLPGVEGQRARVTSDPVAANNTEWVFRSQAWSMVSPRFYFFTSVVQPSSTGSYAVLLVAESNLVDTLGKAWNASAMSACSMNSDAIGLTNISLDHNTSGINLRCNVSNAGAKRVSVVVFDFS